MAKSNGKKIALITGANKGIGFEIANQLGQKGFHIVISARDADRGIAAAELLNQRGVEATFLQMDVSDSCSISDAARLYAEKFDRLDVLINNAAILIESGSIVSMDSSILEDTFRTNTIGPLLVIQNFVEFMTKGGRIINISSSAGSLSSMTNYSPAYSISTTALNAITRQFASELSGKGIAVNSVCPGWVRTDMGGRDATRSVEKGAETAVWLATEASQSVTGRFIKDKKEVAW
ncbi:MAG: SDR family NAD(P)-dependent oxidoreductase [Bacteroidota bacterium]